MVHFMLHHARMEAVHFAQDGLIVLVHALIAQRV
jgi:hypothetical protein